MFPRIQQEFSREAFTVEDIPQNSGKPVTQGHQKISEIFIRTLISANTRKPLNDSNNVDQKFE